MIFFFSVVEVPAWAWLVVWLALYGALGALGLLTPFTAGAGAAYYAQLGGFAVGLAAARGLTSRRSAPLIA